MPKLTEEEIAEHLAKANPGGVRALHLATISHKTGDPWLVPVGYIYGGHELLITARQRSSWLEDIRQNPQVCVTVDDNTYPLRKVTIHARAEIRFEPGQDDQWREVRNPRVDPDHVPVKLPDGREEWDWHQAYCDLTWDEPRALVVIPIRGSKVTSWRMPLEGEEIMGAWSARYYEGDKRRFRVTEVSPRWSELRVVTEEPVDPDYVAPWER